ncbi:uncharacterized protein ARMOST_02152 [Armillaria ostoyae]|uniref:Uncharacterized protein n=1 Tax=Armillaria ostoyae TaxID=47428 RepID=A0A284QQZ2_ARMOS|nr:uncharacterized protein ARMOST_02152 [Armillaria ostoyae]
MNRTHNESGGTTARLGRCIAGRRDGPHRDLSSGKQEASQTSERVISSRAISCKGGKAISLNVRLNYHYIAAILTARAFF